MVKSKFSVIVLSLSSKLAASMTLIIVSTFNGPPKENKDKLAGVTQAVKQVMKFRPIWADYLEDGLRMRNLLHCVSH